MKIKDESAISWAEARHILDSKIDSKELGYEQKKALEHLNKFSKITKKNLKELVNGLSKIEKLQDKHIVSLVSFMPTKKEDINMLFANEHIILSESDKDSIVKLTKEFASDK